MFDLMIIGCLLTTSLYYLGSRAEITRWLWSRYPLGFARFMDCPACAGTWYGFLVGVLAIWSGTLITPLGWAVIPLVGLCALVWTPLGAALLQLALTVNGSAVEPPPET